MPLTSKGEKILSAFKAEYGPEKGERYFYAAKNAGKITGIDEAEKPATDMNPTDWRGLIRGLLHFFAEESREPEHQGQDESEEAKRHARGALTEAERAEVDRDHAEREEMPAEAFLEPASRKYPVKEKRDGKLVYSRQLLLAAAREARMHGHEDLATRADEIRKREFPEGAKDGVTIERLAMDRGSVRSYDQDGRMRVEKANISKATVNPYLGREIPDYQRLGLDADREYRLLRHPDELKKAASTFNAVPLLDTHVPVAAWDHPFGKVVGTTGTEAEFKDPYLTNALAIWTADAIDGIEREQQKELSCGYRYDADMTPGTWEGQPYDGVMRNIKGNHVALVKEGRAGPDVVVGDSIGKEVIMTKLTPAGLVAKGALLGRFPKLIAMDAKVIDPVFAGVTGKTWRDRKPVLALAIKGLAQDASMEDITKLLDSLDEIESKTEDALEPNSAVPSAEEEDKMWADRAKAARDRLGRDETPEEMEKRESEQASVDARDRLGRDETPDEMKEREAKDKMGRDRRRGARDAAAKDAEPTVTKAAMDAAIALASKTATADALKAAREIRDAERAVRPYVGDLAIACDSASAVYAAALKGLGVADVDKIHPSAYPALLAAQPLPDRTRGKSTPIAQDSAAAKSFDARFPGADRITVN